MRGRPSQDKVTVDKFISPEKHKQFEEEQRRLAAVVSKLTERVFWDP